MGGGSWTVYKWLLFLGFVSFVLTCIILRETFPFCLKSMEAAGAKILYQRSVKLRKLRHIPFIGNGDSKAYTADKQEQPYGPAVFIPKQECVSHVTKRMGTGLRALVKDYKAKCLGCVHVYCYIGRSFKPNVVVVVVVVLISVEMRATSSLSFCWRMHVLFARLHLNEEGLFAASCCDIFQLSLST